ncbi:MAG: alpha-glucosidase, partial [Thermoleophilaceae bacterium]|nr:alpha-glucosidase [Thermoleophilaceae bacterium]
RSFQDSDGDGAGDLRGVERRLEHLSWLGVDALWLSPIYPSPLADMGYDVSDYTGVDPAYGTLADFDSLVAAAHARDIRVLMDLVPCHTSIEHPWFREHPDRYIWSDRDGPANNWRAAFGGPAWSRDPASGRWYLHSFYPEQPDLDWRNPEVAHAMRDVIRFWLDRGVDGFRLDALDRLVKDAELRDDPPASAPFALPLPDEYAELEHLYSRNSPDIRRALAELREAAGGSLLVGEVYLPAAQITPYLESLDLAFGFELFHAPWERDALRAAIAAVAALERDGTPAAAWVLSNHDFPRLATRFGRENVRAAAMLLLTLPGAAFVYQGEEIGMADGPGAEPPVDRAGRDGARHPMQWEPDAPAGGFSDGRPWLPVVDPGDRSVAAQREDPGSLLTLYRDLIAVRPTLRGPVELLDAEDGVLAYRRGEHLVAMNVTTEPRGAPPHGELVVASHGGDGGELSPHAGVLALAE